MALTTDVERGALGVMGQPFSLMLNRSIQFAPFLYLMRMGYPDARDQQFLLGLIQMLWDRVEPNGYTHTIARNPLPGTPVHRVSMRAALGDHQVPTVAAHVFARAVGAKHLDTGVRDIWGLERVQGTGEGSGYTEYAFGLPPEPTCNVPMDACEDPHGKPREIDSSRKQADTFLRTGKIENFCEQGVCSYPELSGCKPEETTPSCSL
jgi:hypothetical protein